MSRLSDWVNFDLARVVETMTEKQRRICSSCSEDGIVDTSTRKAVYESLDEILEALFPGCYGHDRSVRADISLFVNDRLRRAAAILAKQVDSALRQGKECAVCGEEGEDYEEKATEIVIALFEKIPEIHAVLMTDVQAAYEGDPAASSFNEIVLSYPFIEAIATHRVAHELYKVKVPIIPRIMSERAHSRTGIDIHPGATIGSSFFIDHGTGVVIGETTSIGQHVKIYQGVTLGALSFKVGDGGVLVKGIKRHPNIEDDVIIYAGATILGGETTVGRGSVIGGNVWLTCSVPPNSKIYNEQQIVITNGDKERKLSGDNKKL